MHLVIFLAILLATLRMSTAQTCDDGKEAQGECECGAPTKKCTKGQICELAAQTCKQPPQNGNAQQGGQNGNAPAAPLRCQDKNGSFLPSATICTDKLGSDICSKIFDAGASGGGANSSGPTKACVGGTPEPADCTCGSAPCKQNDTCDLKAGQCTAKGRRKKRQASGGDKRPEKCDLPELTDYARQCAKTCKICCETVEHGCEDNPGESGKHLAMIN
ncbi:hypothetical protein AAVH_21343 [Aphelenchoides avenae]|nr:hypothetical protein AAVH_21343 [Aphelenchus avenae]